MGNQEMTAGGMCSTGGAAVPLRGVALEGEVVGAIARVVVKQRYVHDGPSPIEAIYTFPLPSEATLVGFSMECAGRRMEGTVQERDEAFRKYDEATLAGHGAALLDQERPNVFTASVGNVLPGEETIIEIAYVERVRTDEGVLRLSIPTTVAPRYIPGGAALDRTAHGTAQPTDRVPDADRISPPLGVVSYRLTMDLRVHGTQLRVTSPSHVVVVEGLEAASRVRFAEPDVALDRDIVLLIEGASGADCCITHRTLGSPNDPSETSKTAEGFVAITHVLDLSGEAVSGAARRPVVFVLDRSGSMGGTSIEEARRALRLSLRQLREGDLFGILAFDDRVERFRPQLVPFTQATLTAADAWISKVDARGGTEMLSALLAAVALAPSAILMVLTDGQVGNEDEILREVLRAGPDVRVHAFGIGSAVSDTLLRNLARQTGGDLQLIHPGERIDDKVVQTFAKALAPRVRKPTVRCEGVELEDITPGELPDWSDGEPLVLLAKYQRPGVGRLEIRGTVEGTRPSAEYPSS